MVAVDPPSNNNSTKTQACLVDCEHLTQIWAERRGHAPSCETDQNHPVEIVPNSAEMNSLKRGTQCTTTNYTMSVLAFPVGMVAATQVKYDNTAIPASADC